MSHFEVNTRPLRVAVLTVSDTRDKETDKGGKTVIKYIEDANHVVQAYTIVKDEYESIHAQVKAWGHDNAIDVIITTGGTGIAKRDVTLEAVKDLYEKEVPGFGEIFRYLSYSEDIGTKALASRAEAGVINEALCFSVPGSVGAVKLAMEKLILPEMAHLVYEINK